MANQAFRQELNILAGETITGTGSVGSQGFALLDTTQYSGSPTYWLEVVHSGSAGNTGTISTSVDSATTIAGATSATKILSRVQVTPGANQSADVGISGDGTHSMSVFAARLIVLQSESTISATQTQIEIGNYTGGAPQSNSVVADITNPKFWKYNSANWDGTKGFSVEVIWKTSAKNTTTITLCRTSDNAANVTVVSAGTSSTGPTRTRVSFTPVNGETYKLRALSSTSKSTYTIYCAKIIVHQVYGTDGAIATYDSSTPFNTNLIAGGTASSGQVGQAAGQSFTAGSSYNTSNIILLLMKEGSPSDNLKLEVLTTSITGTVIATSSNVAGTSLSTSKTWISFAFNSFAIASGTKYYLRLTRDGARDGTNDYRWALCGSNVMSGGGSYALDNNVWSSESSTNDQEFSIIADGMSSTSGITKCEPQFLLLNTADAGTGAQNMLTKYNASEWNADVGSIAITHLIDSDNASNSGKIVTSGGADTGTSSAATGSTQPESSSFSLVDATTYDTNVTNSTGTVAASRLKFVYAYTASVIPDLVMQPMLPPHY
jgi:hypothetical protein